MSYRRKNSSRFVLFSVLAFLLLGCDRPTNETLILQRLFLTAVGAENSLRRSEFKALCENEIRGAATPVTNVEGYAVIPDADKVSLSDMAVGKAQGEVAPFGCFPCFKELVRDGYRYVESFYNAKENWKDPYYGSANMETGLYRYTLQDRGSQPSNCVKFDDWVWRVWRAETSQSLAPATDLSNFQQEYKAYRELLGDRCVVAKRIAALTAPYVYETRRDIIKSVTWFLINGRAARDREWVYERETRKTIAISESYSFVVTMRGERLRGFQVCSSEPMPQLNMILQNGRGGE
jgi:hypothetical protein